MSLQIGWNEYLKLRDNHTSVLDINNQLHLIVDGYDFLVTPTSEEYDEKEKEISESISSA